ncbi:ACT domain-containing protein [Pseudomonas sp. NMI760_13]|uniref:ACT domain-containing protein n=1 Tax=Pseudomonas sp. NMI760_13 TaxID=2903147 RepID=UPI001E5B9CEC|nr:ACT domain-containing protein [Pseudomonas sp. NMI760_13]MCE0917530.1 ACT domain-containing protein [Pseudomonas sp. NMI760_13]
MHGETSIEKLLQSMRPELNDGEYVFATVTDASQLQDLNIVGSFREREGWTVILEQTVADAMQLPYTYVCAWITLTVHSSLEAVGLTAAFATALGKAGISCNVVAAYYHDHIFVGVDDAQRAMAVLKALSDNAG